MKLIVQIITGMFFLIVFACGPTDDEIKQANTEAEDIIQNVSKKTVVSKKDNIVKQKLDTVVANDTVGILNKTIVIDTIK